MLTRRSFLALAAACVLGASLNIRITHAQTANPFFFRDGDRAMFLGDSITQQRQYSTLVESFVLSRFPKWNITFRNTGWGGDTMGLRARGGLDAAFARDIAPLKPTAVTIDFGMNDATAGDKGTNDYVKNARLLADKFAGIGTRIAFLTASPQEKYEAGQPAGAGYNNTLRKYSEGLKVVAADKDTVFVDQLNPMIAAIEAGRASGVLSPDQGGPRLISDGLHPDPSGHLIMAMHILQGLNAPSLVSSVEIDAKTGTAKTEQARVSDMKAGETLTFSRLDDALPWPLPPSKDVELAFKLPGFAPLDALSRYLLKVTNLTAANYKLAIDGQNIGNYTREQLAAGVNLSQNAGPISDQAARLLNAIIDKNTLFVNRWRNVQILDVADWIPKDAVDAARAVELQKRDEQIAAAEKAVNDLRVPAPHLWTLTPVI
jgi:lysophospholipase L1-like esterase